MANDVDVRVARNTEREITLSGSDVDGDSLTFSVLSQPAHGSLGSFISAGNTTSTLVYTPDAGYRGADSFTFEANDGLATSNAATVGLSVFDDRAALVSKNEHPTDYFLAELGVGSYLDLSSYAGDIPPGAQKALYISIPTSATIWTSGQAENLEALTDAGREALGFHTKAQLAQMVQDAPAGSVWYMFGEPNRYAGMTGARFAPVFRYYYTELSKADPTARFTSPSLLNWDFTCVLCLGYTPGKTWTQAFVAEYESRYGKKPPVDIWAINAYPINWSSPPPSAAWNASTVIAQLEGMRQYLDGIAEYVNTPIWITEISLHVGYTDWAVKPSGKLGPKLPAVYEWDRVGDFLITMLDWLDTNATSNKIEKWFFFVSWTDIANPGASGYMGITFFDGPTREASLNCLGRTYRSHVLGETRVKCDAAGNTVPE